MIAMLLTTQNEADVLRLNLEHHLGWGVDHVAVCDNESTDATQEVLRSFGERVTVRVFHDFSERQAHRTACLAAVQERLRGAVRWVGVSDTDEFFWSPGIDMRGLLADVPQDVAVVTFHQKLFLPTEVDAEEGPVYVRQVHRTGNYDTPLHTSYREGKSFYRTSWLKEVDHEHRSPRAPHPEWGPAEAVVHHYMIRDEDQFVMKVRRLTSWRPRKGLRSKLWYHKARGLVGLSPETPYVAGFKEEWWNAFAEGGEEGLRRYYRTRFRVQRADLERHLACGDLVRDDAFARFKGG